MLLMHFTTIQWLCKLTHSIWVSKVSKHGGGSDLLLYCCCLLFYFFVFFSLNSMPFMLLTTEGLEAYLLHLLSIQTWKSGSVNRPSVCLTKKKAHL